MSARPNIVVADGHTANPGDLSWEVLEKLGALQVHARSGSKLVENCKNADIVLTNKEVLDDGVLEQLPHLRFISVLATGTNVVDLESAARRGIAVSNVPAYSTDAVAQHVFALLLELNNRCAAHSTYATSGEWSRARDFSHTLSPIHELHGKVFGIVGVGSIGRRVATIASAFGMRVIAAQSHSRRNEATSDARTQERTIERLPIEQLFREADVVSLHCPLTDQTRHLVDAQRLAWMKPSAFLINTGRGPLVDETALADALNRGHLGGAGLDVMSSEPPPPDNPLLSAPRVVITPHLAWASVEARQRLLAASAENVAAFLRGEPTNLVNSPRATSP